MNIKTSVYIAESVDGFIAREDGSIDWLDTENHTDEDYGFKKFMDSVDAIIMGSNTFKTVLSLGQWLYANKPVYVLSSKGVVIPEAMSKTVSQISAPPKEVINKMVERGFRHLYIDGGNTIQRFLSADLIFELIITQIPVLIGRGISLFGPISRDIRLKHIMTQSYENGFVQSRYEVLDFLFRNNDSL